MKAKPYPVNEKISFWEDGEQFYLLDFKTFKEPSKKKQKKTVLNGNELNDLNGREWTIRSKSVQTFNSPITEKRKLHGAAFPISLAKHFIDIYSKPGDTVLDPFSGVGTTLDAANIMGRHSIGIELNEKYIKLFNQGIDPKDGNPNSEYRRIVIQDSAMNIDFHLPEKSVDFILTSPPYSNLLNNIRENFADKDYKGNPYKNQSRKLARPYSSDKEDLGNISYENYMIKMKNVFPALLGPMNEITLFIGMSKLIFNSLSIKSGNFFS